MRWPPALRGPSDIDVYVPHRQPLLRAFCVSTAAARRDHASRGHVPVYGTPRFTVTAPSVMGPLSRRLATATTATPRWDRDGDGVPNARPHPEPRRGHQDRDVTACECAKPRQPQRTHDGTRRSRGGGGTEDGLPCSLDDPTRFPPGTGCGLWRTAPLGGASAIDLLGAISQGRTAPAHTSAAIWRRVPRCHRGQREFLIVVVEASKLYSPRTPSCARSAPLTVVLCTLRRSPKWRAVPCVLRCRHSCHMSLTT